MRTTIPVFLLLAGCQGTDPYADARQDLLHEVAHPYSTPEGRAAVNVALCKQVSGDIESPGTEGKCSPQRAAAVVDSLMPSSSYGGESGLTATQLNTIIDQQMRDAFARENQRSMDINRNLVIYKTPFPFSQGN